ncbi:MAG: DUF2868 domain-containing protein [Burkholderiaceae bacterium]|nr:DUF2868 domain-containing protein [Burkholderiaceae bacterium]
MNEADARLVFLIRAIEVSDAEGKLLGPAERRDAQRIASERTRWNAAEQGRRPVPADFVARRAQLLATQLGERFPKAMRGFGALRWHSWIGVLLPLLALVFGALAEHVADRNAINILAFPMLGLLLWNLVVYLLLGAESLRGLGRSAKRNPGWVARQFAGVRASLSARVTGPLAGSFANFVADWSRAAAPLMIARSARVLHLSAALLALGAIAGLYVRGLVFEYRAGWDSTFLAAPAVHAVLALFLAPVAKLIGVPFPDVAGVAALRWSAGSGENAARWIHLYAGAAAIVVVVPRLALAALARWRERRLASDFPVPFGESYFRRLLADWPEDPTKVRIVPYGYTPNAQVRAGVHHLAEHLYGARVQLQADEPVAFGDEDELAAAAPAAGGSPAAPMVDVIALFNLAATPETENHGAFIDALQKCTPDPVLVLVDESAYRRRLGAQPGATERLAERREAWSALAGTRGLTAVFADLEKPDLAAVERELAARFTRDYRGRQQ